MEVDEKNFLATAPKNADAADETESWCVPCPKELDCIYAQLCPCLCQCTAASMLSFPPAMKAHPFTDAASCVPTSASAECLVSAHQTEVKT